MLSGLKTAVTVACVGAIRTKDSGCRSVNLSQKRSLWRYKRHSGSVTHTAEDELVELYKE